MLEDFVELHGDRIRADDPAIVAGLGRLDGRTIVLIGHQKGRDVKERARRNFGMAYPEGYRKAMRVMELADRFGFPVVTLVDTPGAYPGVAAEQHGQGGAIARSQAVMARLNVPTVACVIGEGGSGGAVALALADRVLMQENAIYSTISPEGCAAILWRDAAEKKKAAAAFKPDARALPGAGRDRRDRPRARGRRARRPRRCGAAPARVPRGVAGRARRRARPTSSAAAGARASAAIGVFAYSRQEPVACLHGDITPAGRDDSVRRAATIRALAIGRSTPSPQGLVPRAWRSCLGGGLAQMRYTASARSKPLARASFCVARLDEYRRKRDEAATPEPFGSAGGGEGAPIFVVQRHAARRLHYDLRLERDGALASWAVPKGVPLEPGRAAPRRPRRGPPARVRDLRGRDPGRPVRRRHGRDLGLGHVRARRGEAGRRPHRPAPRRRGCRASGRSSRRSSAATRRTGSLIRKRDDGSKPEAGCEARRTARCSRRSARRSRPATAGSYEIKWDGYRIVARLSGRRGGAAQRARTRTTAPASPGSSASCRRRCARRTASSTARCARSTTRAGRASRAMQQGIAGTPIVYYVFDLLELDGEPLVDLPLEERRERLEELLDPANRDGAALGGVRRRRGAARGGEGSRSSRA